MHEDVIAFLHMVGISQSTCKPLKGLQSDVAQYKAHLRKAIPQYANNRILGRDMTDATRQRHRLQTENDWMDFRCLLPRIIVHNKRNIVGSTAILIDPKDSDVNMQHR